MGEVIRYFGYGRELNFGQEAEATHHVDIASSSLDVMANQDIVYEGSIGRGLNVARPGYYVPAGNVVAALDLQTLGLFLRHTLGGYKVTAAQGATAEEWTLFLDAPTGGVFRLGNGAVWTDWLAYDASAEDIENALEAIYGAGKVTVVADTDFTISFDAAVRESGLRADFVHLQGAAGASLTQDQEYDGGHTMHEMWMEAGNVLPSFTARVGKDLFEHVFLGTVANSLQLQVAGELLMGTLSMLAQKDSKATLKAVADLLVPEDYPLAFHEVKAKMGPVGGALSDFWASVKELTLNLSNNLSPERGRSIGSRFPARLVAEQFDCTLSLSLFFENTNWLEDYWGTETGPSSGPNTVVEKSILLLLDGGAYGNCEIFLPRVRLSNIQIQPSGRGEIVQPAEMTMYQAVVELDDGETEVNTPILVTLQNNKGDMS